MKRSPWSRETRVASGTIADGIGSDLNSRGWALKGPSALYYSHCHLDFFLEKVGQSRTGKTTFQRETWISACIAIKAQSCFQQENSHESKDHDSIPAFSHLPEGRTHL